MGALPLDWLRAMSGHRAHERAVVVHDKEHGEHIRGRLIAQRLPASAAEKARARIRRELGVKATPTDIDFAGCSWLFTTAQRSRMDATMRLELHRLRCQSELTFKRWKSLCGFDRLPNHRDDTILPWLYGKLLLALLVQRTAQTAGSHSPPERRGWFDAELDPTALEDCEYPLADVDRCAAAA